MRILIVISVTMLIFSGCISKHHEDKKVEVTIVESNVTAQQDFTNEMTKITSNKDVSTTIEIKYASDIKVKPSTRGDVYIMWGDLEEDIGQYEWNELFLVTRWLSKNGYKVTLNSYARVSNVKEALKDEQIVSFIWSGHGDGGIIRDKDYVELPRDIFLQTPVNLKQIIISACDGQLIKENYSFTPSITPTLWTGSTDSSELIGYLKSEEWLSTLK